MSLEEANDVEVLAVVTNGAGAGGSMGGGDCDVGARAINSLKRFYTSIIAESRKRDKGKNAFKTDVTKAICSISKMSVSSLSEKLPSGWVAAD